MQALKVDKSPKNKAIFFDRDGVINKDTGYVYKESEFIFYEDFLETIKNFKKAGFKLVVITNQSGIKRGFYSSIDFLNISKFMQEQIYKKHGFYLDRIYFCKDLEGFFRKPNEGMILQAKKDLDINLEQSILVGDKLSDIQAGEKAKIKNLYLINRESKDLINNKLNEKLNYNLINSLKQIGF